MNCVMCKSGTLAESTTNHVVSLKSTIIIVKGVPCSECGQCGEKYYDDAVADQLEKIVRHIMDTTLTEIAVVAYSKDVA